MGIENIHPIFDRIISKEDREKRNGHKAFTLWLTGLSGSGKSTLAEALEKRLYNEGYYVKVIDGDNTRMGLCNNLSFSLEDRKENIRRVAELSKLFNESGIITINSFVSPTIAIRKMAEEIIGSDCFYEVFIDTPLEICEQRDVKGLYAKARSGEIKGFTGIDSPFEKPETPDFHIKTKDQSIKESLNEIYNYIHDKLK